MNALQFDMMDEMEQIEAIWYRGKKLTEREDEIFLYILYQIDSFFVEEKIHKQYNVRQAFKTSFSTGAEILKPYLGKIGVSRK